jgi:hypothetical protein
MYQNLAILGAFVLVYSAVAGRLEKLPVSGAIVAMGFGFGILLFPGMALFEIAVLATIGNSNGQSWCIPCSA